MERSGEILNIKGGGGDLIVEGQGRVTASNQLTVALHSSIWDTVSLCMHVCVCVCVQGKDPKCTVFVGENVCI